jgi:hypothetical protein
MKIFKCGSCDQVVFFESFVCTRCNHTLAFLPNHGVISALEDGGAGFFSTVPAVTGERYRLCRNYVDHAVCNWAVPDDDPEEYCLSCRLNYALPPTLDTETKKEWAKLETAKRRLLYTLFELGLPVESKIKAPERGVAFAFLKDDGEGEERVFTGHSDGVITINIAEADDPFREKMREQMGEAYRTVLGHFRHESGHYYWQRLIANDPLLESFRNLFGDEQKSYEEAQTQYYSQGAPAEWWNSYVSAYATMHPWEDWAETWAHYLHIVDGLETARAHGLSLQSPSLGSTLSLSTRRLNMHSFDELVKGWIPLTLSLNSMNRSFGAQDCYPFVLSPRAIEKLHFVHDVIESACRTSVQD